MRENIRLQKNNSFSADICWRKHAAYSHVSILIEDIVVIVFVDVSVLADWILDVMDKQEKHQIFDIFIFE